MAYLIAAGLFLALFVFLSRKPASSQKKKPTRIFTRDESLDQIERITDPVKRAHERSEWAKKKAKEKV